MKTLLRIAALLFFVVNVNAQTFNVTHNTGTVLVGASGVNVTVTAGGLVGAFPTTYCGSGPYWIGGNGLISAPGWYDYTFSVPVQSIQMVFTGMDQTNPTAIPPLDTERATVDINGVFYPMNVSQFTPFPGTCVTPQANAAVIGGKLVATNFTSSGAGNGGRMTIRTCDIYTVRVHSNGKLNGFVYSFAFDTGQCFTAFSNAPCEGDTLRLWCDGDTSGASFAWTGPGSFTSTLAYPVRAPATIADTGVYTVIRTLGLFNDTASVRVVVHPTPILTDTSNAPLCADNSDTLLLSVTSTVTGTTYLWSGPNFFSSTMQFPSRVPFSPFDTGLYKVIATTPFGCMDSASTYVTQLPSPDTVHISGILNYCQGTTFVPFTITGLVTGATLLWYSSPTSTTPLTTPSVPTATPGVYTYWAAQRISSCESPRTSITVRVTTTPLAPAFAGIMQYCQFIGPFVPHTVTMPTTTAVARWYTGPTGGVFSPVEPVPNFSVAGTYTYYVSIIDSGCEGPRTPVATVINPKPPKPVVTPQDYCQFKTPSQVIGGPSVAGDYLLWYGPGVTTGSLVAPTPSTSFAPDTIEYYVTETSPFGCVSDSTLLPIVIKLKPDPPITRDIQYCRKDIAALLNAQVDSDGVSHLNWFYNTIPLTPTPTPFTDTTAGTYTWWVSQTVPNSAAGCTSDSTPIYVTILDKPKFSIEASSPWVCQFDSLTFSYKGSLLVQPGYAWTLPVGSGYANGSDQGDSTIVLKFDSVNQNNFIVKLRATNYNGFCFADTFVKVKVVPQPTMVADTRPDVCLLDTVRLALEVRTDNAHSYTWFIDNVGMSSSGSLNIVSGNSHTGGPFLVSWTDTGLHIIEVRSATVEGCKSEPTFDSVLVHGVPDASFTYLTDQLKNHFCLEDSVYFTATVKNYNNSYYWTPEHAFDNNNQPEIWGRAEHEKSVITLKVTDPYGCYSTQSQVLSPEYCCTVMFPNAFTPNGSGPKENNWFRPYYSGYKRFHMFRIFNRWGQTIFESANSTDARWDGNYNGVPQDMGVYYFYIKYDCGGAAIEQKGDVTLIR